MNEAEYNQHRITVAKQETFITVKGRTATKVHLSSSGSSVAVCGWRMKAHATYFAYTGKIEEKALCEKCRESVIFPHITLPENILREEEEAPVLRKIVTPPDPEPLGPPSDVTLPQMHELDRLTYEGWEIVGDITTAGSVLIKRKNLQGVVTRKGESFLV